MRVLLLANGHSSFQHPAKSIKNGVDKVEAGQIRAMLEARIDFTVACFADSEVEGIPHFKTTVLSREGHGRMLQHAKFLDEVMAAGLMDDHDVILSNRGFSLNLEKASGRLARLEPYAHKLRIIHHDPPSYLMSRQAISFTTTNRWITQRGGRVATVQPGGFEFWEELAEKIRTGLMFGKEAEVNARLMAMNTGPQITDFYEAMCVGDDFLPLESIGESRTVNFTGRPSDYKGALPALKGTQLAGLLDNFLGNTAVPMSPQEESYWGEKCRPWQNLFNVGRSHSEVIQDLAEARVFLQPTMSESAGGIVAFEAACHGVPVITTTDTGRRYLEPFGLYVKVPDRSPKTLAEAIGSTPVLTVEQKRAVAAECRAEFGLRSYSEKLLSFLGG